MSRITAIEVQKKDSERRSIYIDGVFAFGVNAEVLLNLGLEVGQEVNQEDLEELTHAEERRKAISDAIRLIGFRDRSIGEVTKRLKMRKYPDDVIEEATTELNRVGLLDDEKFSHDWVKMRSRSKPKSRSVLISELRAKGVDKELAEQAVEDIDDADEYQMALSTAVTARRKTSKEGDALKKYLSGLLARRGFDWDIIQRVLEEIGIDI